MLKVDADARYLMEELIHEQLRRKTRASFTGRGGLLRFVKYFWRVLEPQTPFVDGWALDAVCDHLQAVSEGRITRLLVNVPPGFMKSLLTDVFWPAWEWGAMRMPYLRYVTFSYSASLTERDNRKFGTLVTSPEYQDLFGDWVQITRQGDRLVSNRKTGWKLASSVGGVSTGERGDRVILDDPHNVAEAESEIVRTETVRWFRESMSNRLNNMDTGAIVIIMQRLHGDDVSGAILDLGMNYVHLMIPMEYEYDRQTIDGEPVRTSIGWYDPRFDEGDADEIEGLLAWPERFPPHVIDAIKTEAGPYAWAGQYGQRPAPRGGGIFKRHWWQLWESPTGSFPVFSYMLASLDSAFTKEESNDPSALTIWGIFENEEGMSRGMLVHAWRKHLEFSADRKLIEPLPRETKGQWQVRTQKNWGLMEWLKYSCERFKVDHLLIEAKASGISAAQELRNRFARLNFSIQLCPVKGSKEARALAVQPSFSQLLLYAPARDWSEMVIDEMEAFPRHKFRDITDSATQAVKFMRDNGLLNTDSETRALEGEEQTEGLRKLKTESVADRYFG